MRTGTAGSDVPMWVGRQRVSDARADQVSDPPSPPRACAPPTVPGESATRCPARFTIGLPPSRGRGRAEQMHGQSLVRRSQSPSRLTVPVSFSSNVSRSIPLTQLSAAGAPRDALASNRHIDIALAARRIASSRRMIAVPAGNGRRVSALKPVRTNNGARDGPHKHSPT